MKKVSFTEMKNGTKEDYLFLEKYEKNYDFRVPRNPQKLNIA